MPINKIIQSFDSAVEDILDNATVMVGGFEGPGGIPQNLLKALQEMGSKNLVLVTNTAGIGDFGVLGDHIHTGILIENGQISKVIASYPSSPSPSKPNAFEVAFREKEVELELVPQGTLAERIRAGGAGIPAFYTATGVGTELAEGKEVKIFEGRDYLMETALRADFALLKATKCDVMGNIQFTGTSQNFNGVMATAADTTIFEVDQVVDVGEILPNEIQLPGIYVDRIVKIK